MIFAQDKVSNDQFLSPGRANTNSFETIYQMRSYYDSLEKSSGKIDKQFERWYDMAEKRLQPSGRFDVKRTPLLRTYSSLINSPLNLAKVHTGNWEYYGGDSYTVNVRVPSWSQGSGGVGRINCLTVDPTNSNILYVGAAIGGVWKSTNGGSSWTSLTDGMSSLSASWICIDSGNTDRIYVAIGDADGNGGYENFRETGIIYTEDGGVTWRPTNFFFDPSNHRDLNVFKLLMDPSDSETMYACTDKGLFHTADSWNSRDTIHEDECWDAEFKPGNSDSLYFGSDSKIRVYINSTQSWFDRANFGNIHPCNSANDRIEIEVFDANPDLIYVLRGRESKNCLYNGFLHFSISKDAGSSWITQSIGDDDDDNQILGYDTLGGDNRSQATYDMCFVVDPNDAAKIMVGGVNIWASSDTGSTWTNKTYYRRKTNRAYTHADQHDLIADGNKIYLCNDGGVYKTTDFGNSFTDLNNDLGVNMMYHVDSYAKDMDVVSGALQDNGINEYNTDQSITQIVPGDGLRIIIDYEDSDIQYHMWYRGSVGKTTDNWDTYTNVFNNSKFNPWDTPMIMDVNDSDTLFLARKGGLYRTYDKWNTFTSKNISDLDYITELAQAPSIPRRLYVAGVKANTTKIYRLDSVYGGGNWAIHEISGSIPDSLTCSGLAVKEDKSYSVWACFDGNVANAKVYYKPTKNGAWQNKTGNLPNVNMNDIVYAPGSNNGVYLATDLGVFYRDDDLGDWIFFSNGLPNVVVKKLEVIDDQNTIRAATYGRGLWQSGTYKDCIVSMNLTPGDDPSDPNYTGVQRYQVSSSISSTRHVVGGHGTDVRYRAGNYIDLKDGFWTKHHSLLQVEIGPCSAEGAKYFKPIKPKGMLLFDAVSTTR